MTEGVLLAVTADPRVGRAVAGLAADHGLVVHPAAAGEPVADPAVIVLDLDGPGAVDTLAGLRARYPEALIAGHLGLPDRERWLAAERAGCDVVANRGALGPALRRRLAAGPRRGRRHPLMALDDAAGRLGVVHRGEVEPVGHFALYHVGNDLLACVDRCPHAGALLSEGEVEANVVTCPRHGSRFDVRTGERVRGPADADLATIPVVLDGGHVYLLVADESP